MIFRVVGIAVAFVVLVVAAILVTAATRPKTIRVERSVMIDAPASKVFPLINDFHQWNRWAPQDREDASMRRSFSGMASGLGAISDWRSRGSAGRGRMEISKSETDERVTVTTDFEKPFKAHNVNEFVLEPAGDETKVTWTLHAENLYMMRAMGVVVSMDRMMGKHLDSGLANLRAAVEGD